MAKSRYNKGSKKCEKALKSMKKKVKETEKKLKKCRKSKGKLSPVKKSLMSDNLRSRFLSFMKKGAYLQGRGDLTEI